MAYIMNINIQADEDIQYILRNIKKSDTGAYVFMSDNRESLINIFVRYYAILMRQYIQAINHWI